MHFIHRFLKKNTFKPLIVSSLLFAVLAPFAVMLVKGKFTLLALAWAFLYALIAYRIFWTGKITLYRKLLFVSLAILAGFAVKLCVISYSAIACPVSVSATSLSLIRNIFSDWRAIGLFAPALGWLALPFLTGRLWCSWACWFGGIDECFSSLPRRALVTSGRWHRLVSELPAAVLLFSLLATLSSGTAIFCRWLCPLKLTPLALHSGLVLNVLQIAAIMLIGSVTLVILPVLTKKRTFCRFVCPLRGFLRWTASFHPLRISINNKECTRCGACQQKCSSLAIGSPSPETVKDPSGEQLSISPYCNFCLACVEACPHGAIDTNPPVPLLLFLSLLFSGLVSILFMAVLAG